MNARRRTRVGSVLVGLTAAFGILLTLLWDSPAPAGSLGFTSGFKAVAVDPDGEFVLSAITVPASQRGMQDLLDHLSRLPEGTLVALTLHGSLVDAPSSAFIAGLEGLGAVHIGVLAAGDSYALLGRTGSVTETRMRSAEEMLVRAGSGPARLEILVPDADLYVEVTSSGQGATGETAILIWRGGALVYPGPTAIEDQQWEILR